MINATISSLARDISHPSEKLNQTRPRLHLAQAAIHVFCDSDDNGVVF